MSRLFVTTDNTDSTDLENALGMREAGKLIHKQFTGTADGMLGMLG